MCLVLKPETNMQSKKWVYGVPYSITWADYKAKSRAKAAVVLEIEKTCDKELAKAEVLLSDVVTDLSTNHSTSHEGGE